MAAPTIQTAFALQQAGRLAEAQAIYQEILATDPDNIDALHLLGVIFRGAGRLDDACACIGRAVALSPTFAPAHANLGNVLRDLGRFDEAEHAYRRALALDPNAAGVLANLGSLLTEQQRLGEATTLLGHATALTPNNAAARAAYGAVLWLQGKLDEAITQLERAIALDPNDAKVHYNLGIALLDRGDRVRAVACYRHAIALKGSYPAAHSSLIFSMDSDPDSTRAERSAERARWHAANRRPRRADDAWPQSHDPDRKLRVGYVSGDFRRHSASYCFGPVVWGHDRSRFEVHCFANNLETDDFTERFKQASDGWHEVARIDDDALERLIRAHRIDILVDLSGHTGRSRLPVFTAKPAPVQVTAWGYADAGIPEIDYYVADRVILPQDERAAYVEQILDLPCAICLPMSEQFPEVGPSATAAHPTFGCLNRFSKVGDEALGLWARILAAHPGSRLLLKDRVFSDAEMRRRTLERLRRNGIPEARVELQGATDRMTHLMAYRAVDLALDPFPQNGGITTLEALWMGVPVVTCLGDTPTGRIAGSILSVVGLADHIARSPDAYVAAAVALAAPRDAGARAALRERLRTSPVGDAALYIAAVEAAYRDVWRRWCAAQV